MKDDRLVKIIMFGRMDGKSASERPNIESVARWHHGLMRHWTTSAGRAGSDRQYLVADCVSRVGDTALARELMDGRMGRVRQGKAIR